MVVVNPKFCYGPFEVHTFFKPYFIVTPSIHQLTCLFQNSCMKLYDGLSMFFHITLGTPHGLLYMC